MDLLAKTADRWHVLGTISVIVLLCAAASATLILVLHPLLARYALAKPNARSSHKLPTPQGGGIAVIGVTVIAASVTMIVFPDFNSTGSLPLTMVLAATVLVAIVGAIDDMRTIDVMPRLAFQIAAVGIMIAALPPDLRVVHWLPWWIERVFLGIGALWVVNLVNFMDGIDWMTVAEVAPVTGGLVLLGGFGALPSEAVITAAGLLGAILGFAPFNRPVAKLFLGDVGSLPIGLLLVWLLILVAGRGYYAAALLLPLYYIADATITLGRRLFNRERIWQAHRTHFYQRAAGGGFTVPEVVGYVFVVNTALVILAALTVWFSSFVADISAMLAGAALVGWLLMRFETK